MSGNGSDYEESRLGVELRNVRVGVETIRRPKQQVHAPHSRSLHFRGTRHCRGWNLAVCEIIVEVDPKGAPINLRARRLILLLFSAAILLAACGGGDTGGEPTDTAGGSPSTTVATSTTTVVTSTTTVTPSGAASDLRDARAAVVRIVAQGSFVDPVEGNVYNTSGSGSGFIIDPSGIAVTNNHVVTGAAFLQVFIEGEDEPRNAKILGVSECSDLAIIDIDGSGFPYLDWFDGDIVAGIDVYAAGFPLGDPEYTITEGIISKEKADGETYWASVDSVIQHTARILPGNSGGPLITVDGEVLAINYAGVQDYDINEAISRDEAMVVLDELLAGNNVSSIGVNGFAFSDGEYSGIWVSGVESGSPAASIGIVGGDIITKMEGLVLATDGTKADYCDILRSRSNDDPIAVQIVRSESGEVFEGTLNADDELKLAFSFTEELSGGVAGESVVEYEYTQVSDDAGILVMEVPTSWADVSGTEWIDDSRVLGNSIAAAPNLDAFYSSWETPGVFFGVSQVLYNEVEPGGILDRNDFSDDCVYDSRYDYEDAIYRGAYDVWRDCGGTSTSLVILEAYPSGVEFVVLVQIQVVTDADLKALDRILATFDAMIH